MNPNDKAMLETAKAGWWVYTQGICIMENKWLLVAGSLEQYPSLVSVTDGRDIVSRCRSDILALHAPTDDPQMATAYKLGEPEEVTREEAARMVFAVGSVYEDWDWQDDEADIWMPSYRDDINIAASVRSPGGNVYKIKD